MISTEPLSMPSLLVQNGQKIPPVFKYAVLYFMALTPEAA